MAEAQGNSSKRVALHIGVNYCDKTRYGGWVGLLAGPRNDAHALEQITRGLGYDVHMLLTGNATRQAVISTLEQIASELVAGDHFVLSFAGHGNSQRDKTWCLYDGEFFDDEFGGLLTKFAAGVDILALMDCCHSGTMIRDAPKMETTSGGTNRRGEPESGANRDGLADAADERTREMPAAVSEALRANNAEVYRVVKMGPLATITAPVVANVLLISGCDDNERSKERGGRGRFTKAIETVWNRGAFDQNLFTFREKLIEVLPNSQTPQMTYVGSKEGGEFVGLPPFRRG